MGRTILHVDMDAFFASVEQQDHPELRGRPVVVGAPPDRRGVVSAASYEARAFGIHSAMPSREAGQRCPQAVFRPVNGKRYAEVSGQIHAIFYRYTPLVEPLSIDEAFLDVSGSRRLFGSGPEIARAVKTTIQAETGLTASIGVAPNKFLAKLASDLEKPDGLTVVPPGRDAILAFLAPLEVRRIWGVGKVTGEQLDRAGIRTIGQLRQTSESRLAARIGRHAARHLIALAYGEDEREIETEREEKSVSREHTFAHDCTSAEDVREALYGLADDVGRRLRAARNYAALGRLKLRWKGFETLTRQRAFAHPMCDDFSLRAMAADLLADVELVKPVRLIGFGVSRLCDASTRQLSLFGDEDAMDDRRERLSHAVDALHGAFGPHSIRRAGKPPPDRA